MGVPEEQAEVTVKMFSEVIEQREQIYKQNLASKQDLQELEARLKQDMRDLALSQIKWFTGIMIAQGAAIVALVKLL